MNNPDFHVKKYSYTHTMAISVIANEINIWGDKLTVSVYVNMCEIMQWLQDVRRCVIWAAMKENLISEKIAIIKAAFNEVGIKEQEENYGTIYCTVTEMSQNRKIPVTVIIQNQNRSTSQSKRLKIYSLM